MAYYVKKNGQLEKIAGNVSISQADWNETDDRKITKIKNQPETLKTLDAVAENSNENALVGANALKELTTTVAGMGSELIKTSAKVNLLANSDLGINVVEKGEHIHLDDSADSKLVEFALYGKARQNTTSGKNLLEYSSGSTVKNGVEYTYNSDGSVTANGTASANSSYYKSITLEAGEYILSGSPSGGSSNTYYISTNIGVGNDYGTGVRFTINDKTTFNLYCNVRSGYNAQNLKFYPMIRLASITDDTYEPYTGGQPSPSPEYPQDIEVSGESYNLIPYPYEITTKTVNGITWTDLGDGRIMANGTATETSSFDKFLGNQTEGLREKLQSYGEVILTGCPSGGGSSTFRLFVWGAYNKGEYSANDYGSGATFTFDNDDKGFGFSTQIMKGVKVENLVFKPMLRKASVKNDRYMPYGKGSVEVKSIGKNLIPYPFYETTKTVDGITTNDNGDGTLSINGTSTSGSAKYRILNLDATIEILLQSQEYKLTWGDTINPRIDLVLTKIDGTTQALYGTSGSITINNTNGQYIGISNMYVNVANGQTVSNALIKPMLRLATDTDDTWQPYKETVSTIPTENGLAGIPVDSGGNYTDENGHQWICDEIVKYADGSGEYIKRVESVVFDGSSDESWSKSGIATNISYYISKTTSGSFNAGDGGLNLLCNRFQAFKTKDLVEKDTVGCSYGYEGRGELRIGLGLSSEVNTVDLFRTWLSNNPVEMVYQLKTPSRAPLTAEQIAEIEKLSTFYPVTNISNDFDCGMKVKYIADSKTYVDKKIALQSQTQEESLMSMFMLLPDSVQAAMIENDTNNLLKESGV